MLLLTRKRRQSILIGDGIEVTVLSIEGGKVQLGIQAPANIPVHRSEIVKAMKKGGSAALRANPAELSKVLETSQLPKTPASRG